MATRGLSVGSLPTWQQQLLQPQERDKAPLPTREEGGGDEARAPASAHCCYPVDEALNGKVVVWEGAPWRLECDALVLHANETLSDRKGANGVVFDLGGAQVKWDCHLQGRQRTGAAVRTRAGGLPCRSLVHAVSPRWTAKYAVAAESALHQAYLNSLKLVLEEATATAAATDATLGQWQERGKGRTVVFSCLYPQRKGYPPAAAARVALRTLRRFLEHHGGAFDKVVFAFLPPSSSASSSSAQEQESEARLSLLRALPLFFPRSEAEARLARGGEEEEGQFDEWGERVLEERRIRVASSLLPSSFPTTTQPPPSKQQQQQPRQQRAPDKKHYYLSAAQRQRLPPYGQLYIPPTPPMEAMVENQDTRRRTAVRRWYKSLSPEAQEAYRFQAYAAQSKHADLSAIQAAGILLGAVGEDRGGRPVVCVDARAYYWHFSSSPSHMKEEGEEEGGGGRVFTQAQQQKQSNGKEGEEEERPLGHDALLLWTVRVLESVCSSKKGYTLLLLDCPPPKQPPPSDTDHHNPASSSIPPPSLSPLSSSSPRTHNNHPLIPTEWAKELGRLLSSPRYASQLHAVLVLHASWAVKVKLWGLGFNALLSKTVYVESLPQLDLFLKRENLPGLPSSLWRRLQDTDAANAHAKKEQRGQQQAAARATAAAQGVSIFSLPSAGMHAHTPPRPLPPPPPPAAASYGAIVPPPPPPAAAATTTTTIPLHNKRQQTKKKAANKQSTPLPPPAGSTDRFAFAFPPPPYASGPPLPPAAAAIPLPAAAAAAAAAAGSGMKGKRAREVHKPAAAGATSTAAAAVTYASVGVGGWKRHSLI